MRKPKGYLWETQQSHPFGINIEDLGEQRDFFPAIQVRRYCKNNYFFFAIKNYCLPIGESLVGHSNVMLWIGGI